MIVTSEGFFVYGYDLENWSYYIQAQAIQENFLSKKMLVFWRKKNTNRTVETQPVLVENSVYKTVEST